ncbi:PREDICTED: mitochondrial inner membrane protease subunit 1 [Merops nubicus]|uniref:mitochondrial inner membrane protease subunit 1 n=1 Tax=Merops nubicus TaxID=57421 RepID=UPI0004F03C64|nr:PREDICTED: mitochondrial inner membrane protease subunit 1 [Merops nubicus]
MCLISVPYSHADRLQLREPVLPENYRSLAVDNLHKTRGRGVAEAKSGLRADPQSEAACFHVPKGHVWLEGDNLRNSTDSRCYGPVPYGLIRGRICFKIWPLNDFGFLRASPNANRFLDD